MDKQAVKREIGLKLIAIGAEAEREATNRYKAALASGASLSVCIRLANDVNHSKNSPIVVLGYALIASPLPEPLFPPSAGVRYPIGNGPGYGSNTCTRSRLA